MLAPLTVSVPARGTVEATRLPPRMLRSSIARSRRVPMETSGVDADRLGQRAQEVVQGERVGQHAAVDQLVGDRPQERLLPLDPVEVAARQLVALADEQQRLLALQVDGPLRPGDLVRGVVRLLRDLHLHAADRLAHRHETGEIEGGEMVDAHSRELLHGGDQQLGAAIRVRGIDLVRAVARDRDIRVAWNPDKVDLLSISGQVHQHDRVGAVGALLARTGVGTDEQPVQGLADGLGGALGLGREDVVDAGDVAVVGVLALHRDGEQGGGRD